MPVPGPKKGEKENDYIGRCMRFFDDENSDLPKNQRLAVCYDKWRKAKGKSKKKSGGNEKKHRNNVRIKKSKDLVKELERLRDFYNSKYSMK
jgi:hypothetical protein